MSANFVFGKINNSNALPRSARGCLGTAPLPAKYNPASLILSPRCDASPPHPFLIPLSQVAPFDPSRIPFTVICLLTAAKRFFSSHSFAAVWPIVAPQPARSRPLAQALLLSLRIGGNSRDLLRLQDRDYLVIGHDKDRSRGRRSLPPHRQEWRIFRDRRNRRASRIPTKRCSSGTASSATI